MKAILPALIDKALRWLEGHWRVEPVDRLYPIDLRDKSNEWRAFFYHVESQPVLIEVPTCRAVDFSSKQVAAQRLRTAVGAGRTWRWGDKETFRVFVLIDDSRQWKWMPLRRSDERRWMRSQATFGDRVPVAVHRVVYRGDVDLWPGVMDGRFDSETAREDFDRLFYPRKLPTANQGNGLSDARRREETRPRSGRQPGGSNA